MEKEKLNGLIRSYVKEHLSPTQDDRAFVSNIYKSFNDLLGTNNCIQIGSYPRYTSVRPLHDLDILYILGDWADKNVIPTNTLEDLAQKFKKDYVNPTKYKIEISIQTHSISFKYLDGDNEVFAVDLVPALKAKLNEFNRPTFYVPEVIQRHRGAKRAEFYLEASKLGREIKWIKTDPLGYIEVSHQINDKNSDFRRSVKFVKGWKNHCKEINADFGLKSFHLEQLVTRDFLNNIQMTVFDSLFKFFTELRDNLKEPIIRDRADSSKFIDQYIMDLTASQIELVKNATDAVLIAFEKIENEVDIASVLQSGYYVRTASSEKFLFDQNIPTFSDSNFNFKADGFIAYHDGFRNYQATVKKSSGIVDTNNRISFKVVENNTNCDLIKWKVRNDNNSPEVRGEITDHSTHQNPERTAYIGKHRVECYAIKNNQCIAKDYVDVIVRK